MILRPTLLLRAALGMALGMILPSCAGGHGHLPPPAPLVVEVSSPTEGAVLQTPEVEVRGRVSEAGASGTPLLGLDGRLIPCGPDGSFSIHIALQEGPNVLAFQAWRPGTPGRGSNLLPNLPPTTTLTRAFRFDPVPLEIRVEVPDPMPSATDAALNLSSLDIAGHVGGSYPVTAFTVQSDAAPQPLALGPANAFSTRWTLAEGPNTLTLRAQDAAGRQAEKSFSLSRPVPPPLLHLDAPLPLATVQPSFWLSGWVESTRPLASFTAGDVPRALSADGHFGFLWALQPGDNVLRLKAVKDLGTEGVLDLALRRDLPPLLLALAQPLEGATLLSPTVTLGGTVSEAGAALTVNGQPLAPTPLPDGTAAFSGTLPLAVGTTRFVLTATAPDGRSATLTRTVARPPGGGGPGGLPQITFELPRPGTITHQRTVLVKGRVDDPSATLRLQGADLSLDAQGLFQTTLTADAEGPCVLLAEATNAYGTGRASASLTWDWTPPRIQWNPVPPSITQAATQVLEGTVDDGAATLSLNGRPLPLQPASYGGRFSVTVPLDFGVNTFEVRAVDLAGNAATLSATVTRNHPPLDLALASPAEGAVVTSPTVALSGTVTESVATVTVNGQALGVSAAADGSGAFSGTVPVQKGPFALVLRAATPDGRSASMVRNLTRPPGGSGPGGVPIVVIDQPRNGALTNARVLAVQGRVDDPSSKLVARYQGPALTAARSEGLPVSPDGAFLTLVPVDKEGLLQISVEATNAYGTGQGATSATILWTLPKLAWDPVPPASTPEATVPLRGTVGDTVVTLSLNDQPLAFQSGRFSVPAPLVLGPNDVRIKAADAAGNVAVLQATITREPPPLRLVVTQPAEGASVLTPTVTLAGTVSEPGVWVKVNGAALLLDAKGAFSGTAPLDRGANRLVFTAEAPDGRTCTLIRLVNQPRGGGGPGGVPLVIFDRPKDGFSTNAASFVLQGHVDDPTSTFRLQGAPLALDAQGAFQSTVPLAKEGPLTLVGEATNVYGTGRATLTVALDLTAPVIAWDPPPPATTESPTLLLTGTLDDPTATVSIWGMPATPRGNRFSLNVALNLGPNDLEVKATDRAGNSSSLHATVTRNLPSLLITLSQPAEGAAVVTPAVAFAGSVSEAGALLTLNGAPLAVDARGAFSGSLPMGGAAADGSLALVFQAHTVDGRTATLTRTVLKPRPGGGSGGVPVVVLDAPLDGTSTNAKSLAVRGHVDDASATVKLQGKLLSVDAQGTFQATLDADREGPLKITAEATNAYGTGKAVAYAAFEWSGPQLRWINPTPAEGAKLAAAQVSVVATANKAVLARINGQNAPLEPGEGAGAPFLVRSDLALGEGSSQITVEAVDRAGNRATLSRTVSVGLAAPRITFDAPLFTDGVFSTMAPSVTLNGSVAASEAVQPLTLAINGQAVPLDAAGRFSFRLTNLPLGATPLTALATTAYGQTATETRTLQRLPDGDPASGPTVVLDSPLEGFATSQATLSVRGRVNKPGLALTVQGSPVAVDPLTLRFETTVALSPGAVAITATATDLGGKSATAVVHGTNVPSGAATYRWDLPADHARLASKTLHVTGRADLPGIAAVSLNGTPLSLTGSGLSGTFSGDVVLPTKGPNALLLEVLSLAGDRFSDRRDVVVEPPMPRIRLSLPDGARPGDRLDVQVQAEPGTRLASVDLTWNGALLAHLVDPFPAQQATVPADAPVGSRLLLEAVAKDVEGESVTARAFVTVLGSGVLVGQAFDDRTGLVLQGGTASLEGTPASVPLDASGRAALPTALPENWVRFEKAGHASVWRSAAVQTVPPGASASTLVGARLTPLEAGQAVSGSSFTGTFAGGVFGASFTGLAGTGTCSLTPLSTQGLPGLLPLGWSAVAGAWLQLDGPALGAPGTLALALPAGAPEAGLVWAGWDAARHAWVALATDLPKAGLTTLPLPFTGGYALLVADPAPTAPPAPAVGATLQGTGTAPWRAGLAATSAVTPNVLPTSAAIQGAKGLSTLNLGFAGGTPIPSGTLIQALVVETYLRVDQALIEPERRSEDVLAARVAAVVDAAGKPGVRVSPDGLALELPIRMSRTFGVTELVQGLIRVAYYHQGFQVAPGGSLLGPEGGQVSQDGVTAAFASGSFSGPTLVRLNADPTASWPELTGQGNVRSPFQLEVVGILQKGLGLSIQDIGMVDPAIQPILVQRRVVQGQRVAGAVGHLEKSGGSWNLVLPAGGNPILEGGSFAVLVPGQSWAWVSGTATMTSTLATTIQKALNPSVVLGPERKAKGVPSVRTLGPAAPAGPDVAVADAVIVANSLQAASGASGAFAVPAFAPSSGKLTITGSRWDLGVKGALDVDVPSGGNTLRLATVPFRVMDALPAENAEVGAGSVVTALLSGPADPTSLASARLLKGSADVGLKPNLSLDGRTLVLSPDHALEPGAAYQLLIHGLKSLSGETAPDFMRAFHTSTAPPPAMGSVHFTRIKVSYPDANLNLTVTIPEGAVPAGAGLGLEATGLGATYAGVMPQKGDAVIPFKASLGERIRVSVQLANGQLIEGYVSRYEAGDGSGRVTVGVDGGRVEATDGSGVAVNIPSGALEAPVEFKAAFTTQPSTELLPEFQQKPILGRVQLLSNGAVSFTKVPLIEFMAPAGALSAASPDGIGAYAVLFSNDGFEADGTPARWFEFLDTADAENGKIRSKGGLPGYGDLAPAPLRAAFTANLQARLVGPELLATTAPTDCQPVGLVAAPIRNFWRDLLGKFDAGTPMPANAHMEFNVSLDGMVVPDPGKVVLQGVAYRKTSDAAAQPVRGAQIYFAPVSGSTTASGRFLARTNACGHYMLMSCMYSDITLQDHGKVIGVDPDFGVSATTFIPATPEATNAAGRKFFVMDDLVFRIQPENLIDHTAPWADMELKGPDVISGYVVRANPETLNSSATIVANVKAYDTQDQRNLTVSLEVDGAPVVPSFYGQPWSPKFSPIGVWPVKVVLSPGSHALEALVRDKSNNLTRIHKDVVALDFPPEPPSDPSKPPDFSLEVDGGLGSARPDGRIRVNFTEPVQGVDANSLILRKAQGAKLDGVQVLGLRGPVTASSKVATVYLLPPSRLEEDATYEVAGTAAIKDVGGTAMQAKAVSFKVGKGQVLVPSQALPLGGTLQKILALGGRMFAADEHHIYLMRMKDGKAVTPMTSFGLTGSPGNDFLGQDIVGMGVFRQVSVRGALVDLLLVTTTPQMGDLSHQAALWAFNACATLPTPELIFGVSLGPGGSGYASSIDCRDGIIVIPRLSSSVLLIDAFLAWSRWDKDLGAVVSPNGHNQQAIIQPFYLADPEYVDAKAQSAPIPAHWSAVLVPVAQGASAIEAMVGYSHFTAQWRGIPMTGMPISWNPYTPGAYTSHPPFQAEEYSQGFPGAQADEHALPGPIYGAGSAVSGVSSASRLAILPRTQIQIGGQALETNLVMGVSGMQPSLGDQGKPISPLGNSLVLQEISGKDGERPRQVGVWPKEPPLRQANGAPAPYEIQRKVPSVDALTGLVAVPVKNLVDGTITWFVLDPRNPSDTKVVSRLTGFGMNGALSNGLLFAQVGASSVGVTKIMDGLAGVDEGECGLGALNVDVTFEKPTLVVASPPTTATLNFDPTTNLWVPSKFIEVQVMDEAGTTVAMDNFGRSLDGFTDENGHIEFKFIPSGKYKVRALPHLKMTDPNGSSFEASVYNQAVPAAGWFTPDPAQHTVLAWPDDWNMANRTAPILLNTGAQHQDLKIVTKNTSIDTRHSAPFNILWVLANGADWVFKNQPSPRAYPKIYVGWDAQEIKNRASFFHKENGLGYLRVNAAWAQQTTSEYSDAEIGHELGHYFMREWAGDMSMGGGHYLGQKVDWTMAFSEGWATFFQAAFRNTPANPQRGPDYYAFGWGSDPTRLTSTLSILFSTLPPSHPPPVPPEGLWDENVVAQTLWRLYGSPNVIATKGSSVIQTAQGLSPQDMTSLYGFRGSLKLVLPGTASAADDLLKMEGCLDASSLPLRLEPWTWSGGTSPGHLHPVILAENKYGNGKDSTVYYRFTPATTNDVTVTVKILGLPSCLTPQDALIFRTFCRAESVGIDAQALSGVGQVFTFTFKPKAAGVPHILQFSATSYSTASPTACPRQLLLEIQSIN